MTQWLGQGGQAKQPKRRSSDGNDPMAKQSESGQGVARVEKSRHDPMPRQGKAARAKAKEFQDSLSASMGKIGAIDAELLSSTSSHSISASMGEIGAIDAELLSTSSSHKLSASIG